MRAGLWSDVKNSVVGFTVLRAVVVKYSVFWDVNMCSQLTYRLYCFVSQNIELFENLVTACIIYFNQSELIIYGPKFPLAFLVKYMRLAIRKSALIESYTLKA
jgi:hypothetical protein